MTMIQFGCGEYTVCGSIGDLPSTYASMVQHAKLHDELGVHGTEGTPLIISVATTPTEWPALVVSQRFDPGPEAGFNPGVLLIPEAAVLFVGAGTRLLGYDLRTPRRLWEDEVAVGFWGWCRHGELVIMSAELELAAWTFSGEKRWGTFVEPPWHYEVRDGKVELDVMGKKSTFPVGAGPGALLK